MNDQNSSRPKPATDPLRSPVRPTPTGTDKLSGTDKLPGTDKLAKSADSQSTSEIAEASLHDPAAALNALRVKMQRVSDEFAEGKINRMQFEQIYRRYSEQRLIIEKLVERNPDSDAWQKVMETKGQTGFLRQRFEAQPLYYGVFRQGSDEAMNTGGKSETNSLQSRSSLTSTLVMKLWALPQRPNPGLARKQLPNGQWLILAAGDHAATLVIFSLEPSNAQARLVRDLHADFERANRAALSRGWIVPERMVFPQRSLFEGIH